MAKLEAVLWDLDGTLLDSEPFWFAAERALAHLHDQEWTDEQALALVGLPLNTSAQLLKTQLGLSWDISQIIGFLMGRVVADIASTATLRPGVYDLLTQIRELGLKTALVTMSHPPVIEAAHQLLPTNSFDYVVSGRDVRHGKPHAEPYLRALNALQVSAKNTIAIEDSPVGLQSATAAGCHTLGVLSVVSLQPEMASLGILPHLSDLTVSDLISKHISADR
jgi:HAD superfamily hydrolase (TIGR01509 family)